MNTQDSMPTEGGNLIVVGPEESSLAEAQDFKIVMNKFEDHKEDTMNVLIKL